MLYMASGILLVNKISYYNNIRYNSQHAISGFIILILYIIPGGDGIIL